MPVSGMRVCVYAPDVHNPRVHGKFYGLDMKMACRKTGMEVARLVGLRKSCIFEFLMEEHWVHMRLTWSIAVWEWLLE